MKLLLSLVNIQAIQRIPLLETFLINFLVKHVNLQLLCGGVISSSPSNSNKSGSSFSSEEDSSNIAGSTSLENTGNSEMMGLAVFKGDKLVGELTARETLCHLILRNELESCNITIPNPESKNASIDIYIYNKSKPKVKVKIVNGSPLIKIDLKIEAKILSVDNNSNYITEESLAKMSTSANQYIKNMIYNYLYKVKTEFGTDIDGFGRYVLPLFKTSQEFEQYNWLENYKNSFFDVNVNTNVQSAFLLSGK